MYCYTCPLLEAFADATRKRSTLANCDGFINDTARPLAHPSNQRMFFSGHRRVHCIKFHSVMMSDEEISHLSYPWNGTRHDAGIFYESGLEGEFSRHLRSNGTQYYIYGDPAYPIKEFLITPFK